MRPKYGWRNFFIQVVAFTALALLALTGWVVGQLML